MISSKICKQMHAACIPSPWFLMKLPNQTSADSLRRLKEKQEDKGFIFAKTTSAFWPRLRVAIAQRFQITWQISRSTTRRSTKRCIVAARAYYFPVKVATKYLAVHVTHFLNWQTCLSAGNSFDFTTVYRFG